MTSIEQIARSQYRGIRCNHIAQGLADLLRQAEANEVSYLAFAESLVTEELQRRNRRRIDMNRRKAAFPVDKRLVEFDYRHQSTITKRQVSQLLDFRFIDERANLVLHRPTRGGQDPPGHRHWPGGHRGGLQGAVHHRLGPGRETGAGRDQGRAEEADHRPAEVRPADHRRAGLSAHESTGPLQPVPADRSTRSSTSTAR